MGPYGPWVKFLYPQPKATVDLLYLIACADPISITGGTVVTTGTYNSGDIAVYQCLTGYIMSGTAYITCTTGTWSASPSCSQQDNNQVYVTLNHDDEDTVPTWLTYVIAAACGLLALLILVCIFAVCCQLFGCFGKGHLFGEYQPGSSVCCCRNRRNSYDTQKRMCKTFPRRYEYDENGRRYHIDDLGRRCYYEHKHNYTTKVVSYADSETTVTESTTPKGTFVTTVNEVMAEKRAQPAKELQAWKPHMHPVRNINTSTK